jgi:PKD repeat protein
LNNTGKYKNIEELYRAKLGNRQHNVPDNFWPRFVKKLRFREFIHFRPGSFNIYYLAGLITVAAVTISVLTIKSEEPLKKSPEIIIGSDSLSGALRSIITEEDHNLHPDKIIKEENISSVEYMTEQEKLRGEVEDNIREGEEDITVNKTTDIRTESNPERLPVDKKVSQEPVAALAPVARFQPDVNTGCAPLSISFQNLSHNYDSCIWEFDDGGISTEANPVWVYDEEGTYQVKLILFGENGSSATTGRTVNVYPRPVARFEVSEGNPVIPDEEIRFYNFSQNSVEWKWNFGDGNTSDEFEPSHFYQKTGSYSVTLIAISEKGCTDSMIITNAFGDNTCFIKFPNAFVPNEGGPTGGYYSNRSDQQEEVFHPVWSGVTSYNLRIYSRRGILVFETDDIEIGWDGYYKGQKADPGVYIWKVRGVFKTGEPFIKGGDVTVLPKW